LWEAVNPIGYLKDPRKSYSATLVILLTKLSFSKHSLYKFSSADSLSQ